MAGSVYVGKTFDEAVRKGLEALRLTRAEAVITTVEEGKGGFLGIGARPFKVSVARRPGGVIKEPAERAAGTDDRKGGRRGGREERPARATGRGGREQAAHGRGERGARDERPARSGRDDRPARGNREERPPREGREERPAREDRAPRERQPQADAAPASRPGRDERRERPAREERRESQGSAAGASPVPPTVAAEAGDDAPRKRRRRGRRGGRGRRRGGPEDQEGAPRDPRESVSANGTESAYEHDSVIDMAPAPVAIPPRVEEPVRAPAPAVSRADEPAAADPMHELDPPVFAVDNAPRGRREPREGRGERFRSPRAARPELGEGAEHDSGPDMSAEELTSTSKRLTEELLTAMGFEPKVTVLAEGNRVDVTVQVDRDDELLNGRQGETRQALQHLLNRFLNKGDGSRYHLQLEVNDFWQQREVELEALARKLADDAITTNSEVVSDYLNSQERRIMHVTLKEDGRVRTFSLGTGMVKRVAVAPAGFPDRSGDEPAN